MKFICVWQKIFFKLLFKNIGKIINFYVTKIFFYLKRFKKSCLILYIIAHSLKSNFLYFWLLSVLICKQLGFSINLKIKNLSNKQINKILKSIEQLKINLASDLKKKVFFLVKNSIFIKSYKGLRKIKGLPVRGQRTHTNAKSSKKMN